MKSNMYFCVTEAKFSTAITCVVLNRVWLQHLQADPPFISCLFQSGTAGSFSVPSPVGRQFVPGKL